MSSRSKHYTEDFKQEAVRLALTSGLPRHQIASDLGIGRSTLNTWIKTYRDRDVVAAPGDDVSQELMRLRRVDLSRFSSALCSHLSSFSFESQGAFPP